jgi:hypothetical protein
MARRILVIDTDPSTVSTPAIGMKNIMSNSNGEIGKKDDTGAFTPFGGGGTPLIEKTYAELALLKSEGGGGLIPGQKYLLTDFQTIYDQPDFNSDGSAKAIVVTKTEVIEPLILTAVHINKFSEVVESTIYPKDKLRYDFDWNTTEVMDQPAKGRISERIDERNNRTDYDHRHIEFKRYERIDGSGVFDSYKDTGFGVSEFLTFGYDCFNNYIGNFTTYYEVWTEPFLLANNVFFEYCDSNKTGNYFMCNSIGYNNNNNIFGDGNYANILGEANYLNTFGHWNENNIFGDWNHENTFKDYNSNNDFGNENAYNKFTAEVDNQNLTNATYLKGEYNCTIFKTISGDIKLSYIDVWSVPSTTVGEADSFESQMVIKNITE